MKYTSRIGELILEVNCDKSLYAPARQLLEDLCKLHKQGPQLKDQSTLMYGWVRLRLKQVKNVLHVCEPDFLGSAIENHVPSVDFTLRVLKEQALLIGALHCPTRPAFYSDTLVLAKGCLSERDVYLERQTPVKTGDSGWYIGATSGGTTTANELEVIQVFQLLLLRPELMVVLALPEHYLAAFSGEKLQYILDSNDHQIWPVQ